MFKLMTMENQELIEAVKDVTILFADIKNFTKYSSGVEPSEVVDSLKKLFIEFDKKCIENNVFKLYTIGDCYVVISIVDKNNRDPQREAFNVVHMGFSMI